MKCWCFHEEQLAAAMREHIDATRPTATADDKAAETRIRLDELTAFLTSDAARRHKLGMHGIWDKPSPAPAPTASEEKKA